jgi:hypothetical protein
MEKELLTRYLQEEMALDPAGALSLEDLTEKLEYYIDGLIQHDFQKLVMLLYRIDVSETKLRLLLKQNQGENSARMIAHLIIERQKQKIRSRQEHKSKKSDLPADDGSEEW